MALPAGTRLGSYEIVAPLGSGGMGDVYRARDSRLNRDVAIKVLPERLAHDPVALARFEREAQAVAALSHPNILAIFDFGTQGTTSYAVSELLDGETLRARLAEGALPPRKAVEIAIGVARGIAAAHERGIIHRDLKPENIFITSDSVVKILDFGLARQAGPESVASDAASETRAALTGEGTVLGTVGYMAPEQIRGQAVDARADLFALGAVLYEMLAGERAFSRDTAAETMAAILKEDPPDFSGSRTMNPVLERIVRHCLEKIPAERFQTARDVAFALEALSGAPTPSGNNVGRTFDSGAAATRAARTAGRERWFWLAATLLASSTGAWFAFRAPSAAPASGDAVRTVIQLPRNYIFRSATPPVRRLAISPDGKRLAYVVAGRGAAETTLYVYSFAAGTSTVVPDSRAALGPFWSTDGNTLAFTQDNRLMTVDAAGGRPTELMAANPGGAAWNGAGDIVSIDDAGRQLRFMRHGTGEWREIAGGPAEKQRFLANPIWLPDGQRFIFTMGGPDVTTGVYQGDINGTPWRRLRDLSIERDSMNVSYIAGHLISVRDRMIVAIPFDPDGDNQRSEPVVLAGPVDTTTRGSAAFVVSDSLLVYQPTQAEATTRLLWYDRAGANMTQLAGDAGYSNLELSPDGSQLLVSILDPAVRTRDIWVFDLKRGVPSRLTSDPRLDERSAVWGRDNASFVYRGENRDLFRRPIGAGTAQPFVVDGRSKDPRMFSTDGKYFIYRVSGDRTSNDIWVKPLDPEGPPRALIASVFNESYADVSPDGRWIVYVSDESGQDDVYVTAFPSGAGKWRVSPAGGSVPRWSHDGRELFYLSGDRVLMRAAVRPSGPTFDFDAPTALFQTNADRGPGPQFIVTNDGKRFLINSEIAVGAPESLGVVANWQALLKKK